MDFKVMGTPRLPLVGKVAKNHFMKPDAWHSLPV
jgi:hypothetical protein